jgi:2-keto-4-pentenoate hydratase
MVDYLNARMMEKRGINHDILIEHIWRGAITSRVDAEAMEGMTTLMDGQLLQLDMLDRFTSRGEDLAGWKVGLTSGRSRDAFGKGVRPFGYILANRILKSGETLHYQYIKNCGIENELCFIMGEHLAGDLVNAEMVRKAVCAVAPAFEITETRIEGRADPGIRVADNLSHWGIVVGPQTLPVPDDFDFEGLEVVLRSDGREVERVVARGRIDDHFESIAAMIRELAKFDLGVRDGHRIITGSLTHQRIDSPGHWDADFSGLGSVAIDFA